MTTFLLATDSVHATAAGCDYLADRLDSGDEVVALAVLEPGDGDAKRDADDALNVATVRLPGAVETARREGDPAEAILDAARDHDADEIVLVGPAAVAGSTTGPAGSTADSMGSTIREVLAVADRPVVVVPAT